MIIQNADTFFLRWTHDHRQLYFPHEAFTRGKVKHLLVIPGIVYDDYVMSPGGEWVSPQLRSQYDNPSELNDTLTLFDQCGNQLIDALPLYDLKFIAESDSNGSYLTTAQGAQFKEINSNIDPSLSYVTVSETRKIRDDSEVIAITAIYDSGEQEPQIITTRSKTFDVDTSEKMIYLSDITYYFLRDKKVKKIEIRGLDYFEDFEENFAIADKFITIRTFDGKTINQLPTMFLCKKGYKQYSSYITDYSNYRSANDIFFDNLQIDEDKTFIENPYPTRFKGTITFYY